MSTMPTIPMISPDGSIGDIPLHQTNAASQQGFKVGKEVEINGQKGVIPFDRYGDFMKQHGPITGVDAPQQTEPQKGMGESFLSNFAPAQVIGALADIPSTAKGIADAFRTVSSTAERERLGSLPAATQTKGILSSIADMTGVPQVVDQAKAGNYSGALGSAGGIISSLLLPKVLPKVAGVAADAIADARLPRNINPLSASEEAARAVTKAVNPAPPGMPNFIDAVQKHAGDITQYIRANNLRVDGVLDYAKAARGAAQEAYQQYRGYLDPIADKRVPVGPQYQGTGAGEVRTGTGYNETQVAGRNASLGDIDRRIGQINDLTHKADTGKATIDTPTRFALESEHGALTNTLHQAIADSIGKGITPDDVAALRQKFGKLNTIADQSDLAVNHRMGIEAGQEQGSKMKEHTLTGLAVDTANKYFRGGPNGIADSALVKAARSPHLTPSNLKLANAIMQSQQSLTP